MMRLIAVVAMVITVLSQFHVSGHGAAGDSEGVNYLMKYGYLGPQDLGNVNIQTQESFVHAIKQFQQMAGLNITGQIDPDTIHMMGMPRCGVPDEIGNGIRRRRKRYKLQGSKWPNTHITYKISSYTPDLSEMEVDTELRRAFGVWSQVSALMFEQRWSGSVDIDIFFSPREHGDGNPFDGPGKTLAHAYFPGSGGDAHFDEAETFTIGKSSGINLFQVAAHEFGHSLGLAHSRVHTALMAPFYRGYQESFKLDRDDTIAIQELYGINRNPGRPTARTTRRPNIPRPRHTDRPTAPRTRRPNIPRPRTTLKPMRPDTRNAPDICRDAKIDAITRTPAGETYIFKGEYYFRLNKQGIDKSSARKINWDWMGVTGPIDSALTWSNGYTFLFKGDRYWKFNNLRALPGYPRPISTDFRGVPNNIDAAFVWSGNEKTYFIKGNQYWRYTGYRVNMGYPKPLPLWNGIPATIDGAFKWSDGRTYFFKDGTYSRYNDKAFTIDAGYPKPTAVWWFRCSDALNELSGKAQPYSDMSSNSNNNDDKDVINDDKDGYSSALPVISSAISLCLILFINYV